MREKIKKGGREGEKKEGGRGKEKRKREGKRGKREKRAKVKGKGARGKGRVA